MLLIIIFASLCYLGGSLGRGRQFLVCTIAVVWLSACFYGLLDGALNLLPNKLVDKHSTMMEMENSVREYLATGNPAFLQGIIPYPKPDELQQRLSSNTIRQVLPSNLLNPNHPLVPSRQKSGGDQFLPNGYPDDLPPLDKPVIGSYTKSGVISKTSSTLQFDVPRGTRQVDIQVAGYPNARGIDFKFEEIHKPSYSIAPPMDPGENWQTISVALNPKSTSFKLEATDDRSEAAWLAFSMPVVSNGHLPGRLARSLASGSLYFLDFGLVLLLLGALGGIPIAEPSPDNSPASPQSRSIS
jgi:hypothetical protein